MKHGFVKEQSGGLIDVWEKAVRTYGILESASPFLLQLFFVQVEGIESPFNFPNPLLRR